MSEVTLVAITSAASLMTVLFSRIRFIFRPCSEDPENDDVASANTNVYVVIQNHIFGVKGAGLA